LNDIGDRIFEKAGGRHEHLFFVRTGSGKALDATTCLQACIRGPSFDMGHTKVRILLNDKCDESYAGLKTLFEEIFKKDPNAIIVFVHDAEFCLELNSHLLDLSPTVRFKWEIGRGVAIKYENCFRHATTWI
jgi:hypothetical protein